MSILCFLVAIGYYMNGVEPKTEFFGTWALFSIADALWLNLGRR
nr:MAG TPA: hypothetical protein [Caudoviricetes sp.]